MPALTKTFPRTEASKCEEGDETSGWVDLYIDAMQRITEKSS